MDSIHQHEGKWYFWGGTWAHKKGPFGPENKRKSYIDYYMLALERLDRNLNYKDEEIIPTEDCPSCGGRGKIKNLAKVRKKKDWLGKSRWIVCNLCNGYGLVDWITKMRGGSK